MKSVVIILSKKTIYVEILIQQMKTNPPLKHLPVLDVVEEVKNVSLQQEG